MVQSVNLRPDGRKLPSLGMIFEKLPGMLKVYGTTFADAGVGIGLKKVWGGLFFTNTEISCIDFYR